MIRFVLVYTNAISINMLIDTNISILIRFVLIWIRVLIEESY